jgi:hypothetical protein
MTFFDLRFALGWLFVTLGILLVIAGLRPAPVSDVNQSGININLIWGGVLIAFGALNLWLASRQARKRRRAGQTARTDSQKH